MNVERNVKLLLLKLNKQGHDVSLLKYLKYNKEFGNITSFYKLSFWHKVTKRNRKGELKEINVPETYEFSSGVEMLKYMVVRSNERKTEGIC